MIEKIITIIEEYIIYALLILSFSLYSNLTQGTIINSLLIWPIVFLSFVCILYRLINYTNYNINGMMKYLVIFLISYVISMLLNITYGFYQPLRTLILMVILFFVVCLKRKQDIATENKQRNRFINLYVTITTILSFFSLCVFNINQLYIEVLNKQQYIKGLRWGRLQGLYTDANYGSVICLIAICMILYCIYKKKIENKKSYIVLYIISLIINFSYITLADSRTALLALLVTGILSCISIFRKNKIKMIVAVLIVLTLIFCGRHIVKLSFDRIYDHKTEKVYINGTNIKVIYDENKIEIQQDINKEIQIENKNIQTTTNTELIPINENNIYDRQYQETIDISNRRFDLWRSSFEIFKTKPIFGVSFENIENYSHKVLPDTYLIKNDYKVFDNFHNIIFNVLAGQGIFGTIVLFVILCYIVIVILTKKNKCANKNEEIDKIFMKSIITIGILESMLIGDIIYYISPACVAFWFFLGYLINYINEEKIKNRKYSKLYRIIPKLYRIILVRIFNLLPIDKEKIVFSNYSGKGYGDNSKYILEEINRRKLNTKLIWVLSNESEKEGLPTNVKWVIYNSIDYFFHMCTAKIWIDNHRKIIDLKKRKGQYYIQTWHGGIALKKIEKDAQENLESQYIKQAIHDSNMTDLYISNSTFCTNMYKRAFWYNGRIEEFGTPRNDILINNKNNDNVKKKVLKNLNINEGVKILLYAPTFRKDEKLEVYDIDIKNAIDTLHKKTDQKWICLVRLHPNIAHKSKEIDSNDSDIIDVSNYNDMYELMLASDILITDYSSIMFEFSYMKKPVFLYASDVEKYINERGFYFDYFSLPYTVSQNNMELENSLKNFNMEDYNEKIENFFNKIELKETGKASEKVVDIIVNEMKKG